MLFRRFLNFSSRHIFQLAVDDAGEAVADGNDGLPRVVRRWGLREATFCLKLSPNEKCAYPLLHWRAHSPTYFEVL